MDLLNHKDQTKMQTIYLKWQGSTLCVLCTQMKEAVGKR